MELWIRSQNKRNLMKAEDIVAVDNYIEIFKQNDESTRVGEYKTKERALEVLDEINERIMLLNTLSIAKGRDTLLALKNALPEEKLQGLAYPYEMPKD